MGFMAPLMIAGLAMSAAGAGANYMEKKKTEKALDRIQDRAQGRVDRNTAEAQARWGESLEGLTKEKQQEMMDEAAGKRYAAFEEDTQDVPSATNVMNTTEGAPAIVKTEAAKQLGDQLAAMKAMMQARARLGSWDDRGLKTGTMLGRSGQDIARLGSFSAGTSAAAANAMQARAQKHSPLGDILMGAGSLAMGAGGMAGGLGAAAGAGAAGASGAAGAGAAGAGASQFAAGAAPTFLNWFTTPLNQMKYRNLPQTAQRNAYEF